MGNLIGEWKKIAHDDGEKMKIYLAGLNGEKNRVAKNCFSPNKERPTHEGGEKMKIFLAGNDGHRENGFKIRTGDLNILESFYYIQSQEWMFPLIKQFNNFLLDSGAFTFMNQVKDREINWDQYIEEYAAFINKLDIELFFELDIDVLVGIEEAERLRAKLERLTGKKSIPVWHTSRGHDYWLKMIKEYDYVSIGGIVTKEIKPKHYPIFSQLIREAHAENCKVHALGFTNLKGLTKYRFDSVDSTAWLSGNRFGAIYEFNGKTMIKHGKKPGQRVKSYETAINNFVEWVKFCEYAEKYL